MAVWLIRAGSQGEFEQKFISENRVYIAWDKLNISIADLDERTQLIEVLKQNDPDAKSKKLTNHASQLWPFAHAMQIGDRVILPSKIQPLIYVGTITSDYCFDANATNPFYHWRTVKWLADGVPRTHFSQDLLYSFGAFMTICRIQRNNAETRLNGMEASGWQAETIQQIVDKPTTAIANDEYIDNDLEEAGRDQIIRLINARFKGHDLTRLVMALLSAQGYTCWQSPEGADSGVDILAGSGSMGFDLPQICVEVKSGDEQVDRPTVDKLIGAMTKFNGAHGLFVAWGGFKGSVQKELASSYFRVRLWTQKELLQQLFVYYDKLNEEVKAELPLKRIWTVAAVE